MRYHIQNNFLANLVPIQHLEMLVIIHYDDEHSLQIALAR